MLIRVRVGGVEVSMSEEQLAVMRRVADGRQYAQIARELHLSVAGVRWRARRVREKLGAATNAEAVCLLTQSVVWGEKV